MKEIAIKENHLYNKTYTRGKRFVGRYVAVYVLRDLAAKRLKKAKTTLKQTNNFKPNRIKKAVSLDTAFFILFTKNTLKV